MNRDKRRMQHDRWARVIVSCWLSVAVNAMATEEICFSGSAECTTYSHSLMRDFASGATPGCGAQTTLPPDPIGMFASQDNGGQTLVLGDEGIAAAIYQCQHPIGSQAPNGGIICAYGQVGPLDWTDTHFFSPSSGVLAGGSGHWNFDFLIYDPPGTTNCGKTETIIGAFGTSKGSRVECPAGWTEQNTADGNSGVCYRNRFTCDQPACGNPISIGDKEKHLVETDFLGGGPFPLSIVRYYGSQSTTPALGLSPFFVDPFGRGWKTQYHRTVSVFSTSIITLVTVRRETGESRVFRLDAGNVIVPQPTEKGVLVRLTDGTGALSGWQYTTADEYIELYDANGRLTSITHPSGTAHLIAYDSSGRISTVTDSSTVSAATPRRLQFTYNGDGRIATITVPGGLVFAYAYDASSGALTQVTYPVETGQQTAPVRTYQYANALLPWSVTGIVDERGIQVASYNYDSSTGNATSTQLAGGVNNYTVSGSPCVTPGGSGCTSSVTDPLGTTRNFVFSSTAAGSTGTATGFALTELDRPNVDANGNVIPNSFSSQTYQVDANGNVTLRTDESGKKTQYTFDLTRNLETLRKEAFSDAQIQRTITTNWHATRRLPKQITEPLRITTYAYNGEPGVSCAPAGASTALLCTKTVQATTNATGADTTWSNDGPARTTSYSYDALGHAVQVLGPRRAGVANEILDQQTTYSYSPTTGDLQTINNFVTASNALTTQITNYDAAGRVTRAVDPNGMETLTAYSARGWLTSRSIGTQAAGYETTSYSYDASGLLTRVTIPEGSAVGYSYDGARRLTDVCLLATGTPGTTSCGVSSQQNSSSTCLSSAPEFANQVHYILDSAGNRVQECAFDMSHQLVRRHSRQFDALNRLFQDFAGTIPQGQTTQPATGFTYYANGTLQTTTDPLARSTTNIYDNLNRITQVQDPQPATTAYTYNGRDKITRVLDGTSLATTYVFNGHDELLQQASPDTGTTSFTYDFASNLKTKTDARGGPIGNVSYTYDGLNRLTTIAYSDESVTYTYDNCTNGIGRLCSISDGSGTTAYTYDIKGHVASKTQTVDGVIHQVYYAYNNAGQLATITLPSRHQVAYTYAFNRPISATLDGRTILSGAVYEPFGPNGGWVWGNSAAGATNTHTRVFDLDFRPTRLTTDLPPSAPGQPYFDRVIAWDKQGRVQSISDTGNNSPALSVQQYDAMDRITFANSSVTNFSVSYNAVGDRIGAVNAYTYFAGTHRLQSVSTSTLNASYTYDNNGNVLTAYGLTWTYGGSNRPAQVGAISFKFNALGQRVKKSTPNGNTRFVYDEVGRLLGEYNETGGFFSENVWLEDLPVAVIRP